MPSSVNPSPAASELRNWFLSIQNLNDQAIFDIVPPGPHRQAIVLDTLKRNARIVSQSPLDHAGQLYGPLCFFLAAACQNLGVKLGLGHWQAALTSVIELHQRSAASRAISASLGLPIPSPAQFFKQEFDEAIGQSAITGGPSFLDHEDRQIGLGLAINWALRLLLAYAVECSPTAAPSHLRDLSWVAFIVRSLGFRMEESLSPDDADHSNDSPINQPNFPVELNR